MISDIPLGPVKGGGLPAFGSLGFTATFTTGDTLYFMSVKLWASSKVVMVPDFLEISGDFGVRVHWALNDVE